MLKHTLEINPSKAGKTRQVTLRQFGFMALCLLTILFALFWKVFRPGYTLFSNDGPLGAISSHCAELPAAMKGLWQDLNWLGLAGPSAAPSLSVALSLFLGPLGFSKLYAFSAILFVGLCAWFCFRCWRFSPLACILGGLATALNAAYFSTACWGVAAQPIAFGMNFLALAALADLTGPKRWLRVTLGGFAVGMGVVEAFDIGAIFSVFMAAFVIFQALTDAGSVVKRLAGGFSRLALVAVFAGFIAAGTVNSLVSTQIKGVAGMEQDVKSKADRWAEATMWSLPKREMLSAIIPGLFGFRMDTPQNMGAFGDSFKGGAYWGLVGSDPVWDAYFASGGNPPIGHQMRFGGGGCYAGVLLALIAVWAAAQSFRKENSVFLPHERRFIWFWCAVAVFSLLMSFGRFVPFYQFFYALPYASTIRNPAKFVHPITWASLILFAYGLNGLSRRYLAPSTGSGGLGTTLKTWWAKASVFDKNWVRCSAVALGASLLGWLIYASSRERLVAYIADTFKLEGRGPEDALELAQGCAAFSLRQVGWFIFFLLTGTALLTLILSGYFRGARAKLGSALLGLCLVLDLGASNLPWVIIWNYDQKYASNPVIDYLRERPYENRVAILPFKAPPQLGLFTGVYGIEWKQQLFQYYNIQSMDVVMMPRKPTDYVNFEEKAMAFDGTPETLHRITRHWALTNTRYLLGAAGFLESLNKQIDPVQHRFRIVMAFELVPKLGVSEATQYSEYTAVTNTSGPYALFEFTGTLPRAKLYANWQVSTNDQATLATLASTAFDPAQTLLVADPSAVPANSSVTNQPAGSVDFTSYSPKRLTLQANANAASVLLLNDRFDPNWKVLVDSKPAPLLRCNYLMRGVQVPAGQHNIEFRFEPSVNALYVSLAAVIVALGLVGLLAFSKPPVPEPSPRPAALARLVSNQ
jgi:hypothetical protein